MKRLRDENGLILPSKRSYEPLLQYKEVQDYANSYRSNRGEHLDIYLARILFLGFIIGGILMGVGISIGYTLMWRAVRKGIHRN